MASNVKVATQEILHAGQGDATIKVSGQEVLHTGQGDGKVSVSIIEVLWKEVSGGMNQKALLYYL